MSRVMGLFFMTAFILIGIGTFYDFQITYAFHGYFPSVARFTELFGEVPFTLSLAIPFAVFFHLRDRSSQTDNLIQGMVFNVFGVFFSVIIYLVIFRYIHPTGDHSHGDMTIGMIMTGLCLGVVTHVCLIFIFGKMMESRDAAGDRKWGRAAISMFVLALSSFFIMRVIKMFAARPRFWALGGETDLFVPWYKVSGPTLQNEHMSFVSGHAVHALILLGFAFFFAKGSKRYTYILVASFSWYAFICLGRLLSGQHFLTDLVFGGIVTAVLFLLIERWNRKDTVGRDGKWG